MNKQKDWDSAVLPPQPDDELWEFFHENTKLNKYDQFPPKEYISKQMESMWLSLPFQNQPTFELPPPNMEFDCSLGHAIETRVSGRDMERCPISLETLSTILYSAYGVTRSNEDAEFPRPFRTVPSGGGLYPLEIYLHITQCPELENGIYHYNPSKNLLALLRKNDVTREIASALMQPHVATDSSIMVMVTGVFERSTFKYGARGYRFAYIEAGHVGQNVNLACNALGLSCLNIGGYQDRVMDKLLELDGIRSSTIYMMAIGKQKSAADTASKQS